MTIYYFIKTDKQPNLNNINLTEDEKAGGFKLEYINIHDVEYRLNKIIKGSGNINKIIATETLESFNYLKKHIKEMDNFHFYFPPQFIKPTFPP